MSVTLGFDTATPDTVVGAVADGELVHAAQLGAGPGGRPRHGIDLLPEVERAVAAAGGWSAVERIAVGVGPGSFTGLRIGIATAHALGQSTGTPVVGVISLAALARGIAGAQEEARLAVVDARRGEVFAALYDAGGGEVWPPLVASPQELGARIAQLARPPVGAGDGAVRFRTELTAAGARVPDDADAVHRLSPAQVCAIGAGAGRTGRAEPQPIYLRPPDAQRWREQQAEQTR